MARVSRVQAHLPWAEVNRRYRQARRPAERRHWLIILSLQADPRPAEVAARQLGLSRSSVNHVVAAYNRRGPAALEPGPGAPKSPAGLPEPGRGGGVFDRLFRPGGPGRTEPRAAVEPGAGSPAGPPRAP